MIALVSKTDYIFIKDIILIQCGILLVRFT